MISTVAKKNSVRVIRNVVVGMVMRKNDEGERKFAILRVGLIKKMRLE